MRQTRVARRLRIVVIRARVVATTQRVFIVAFDRIAHTTTRDFFVDVVFARD